MRMIDAMETPYSAAREVKTRQTNGDKHADGQSSEGPIWNIVDPVHVHGCAHLATVDIAGPFIAFSLLLRTLREWLCAAFLEEKLRRQSFLRSTLSVKTL